MPAQGNALGHEEQKEQSPERAPHHVAPLQGVVFSRPKPRALPWAGMVRTVGASEASRTQSA